MYNDLTSFGLKEVDANFELMSSWINKNRIIIDDEDCFEFEYYDGGEEAARERYLENPASDEFAIIEYEYICIYMDNMTGNKIILNYSLLEDDVEELGGELAIDMTDVINSVMPKPFAYLSNVLNESTGVTVFITKIIGTTSDYLIYYPEYHLEYGMIHSGSSSKYVECKKPGKFKSIIF